MTDRPRLDFICGTCGSDDVSLDAWADWDARTQQWVLPCTFDYSHCHACEGDTRLVEAELAPSSSE
jgi:hypothetical protein